MKKLLKEYWFVLVVIVFFVGISVYFTYDQHKDDLPGKTANGKDVVFAINDKDYTADELYEGLYKQNGKAILSTQFINIILDQKVPNTTEITNYVQNLVNYYASQYSDYGGLTYLNQLAQYWGYPDFKTYMTYNYKTNELCSAYIKDHSDKYWTDDFVEKYNPRVVSYCLVKFDDPDNPTADDLNRLQKAQEAWTNEYNAEKFADFAKGYSDDSSTASKGGVFGYIDAETTGIDQAFKTTALSLEKGQVSEWVFSESFGWFLIKCDDTSYESMQDESGFVSSILEFRENATNEILWASANDLGLEIKDEAVKEFILKELNVTESEEK